MAVFTRNRRRSYKFVFSGLLFLFCMARVAALALRCAWAVHPRSVRLGIASQVFTAAGVLILFVTNLVFAQRVVRACHPFFGWGRGVTGVFWGLFGSAVVVLVAVVTVTVQGFFVRDEGVKGVDRGVQLGCATYLAVYAFLPVPLVMLAAVVPRKTRIDKFGEGHFRTKFALLTVTASLLAAGAVFRAVVAYAARPVDRPAWFHGKACYYCFNFVVELLVVYIYALSRFDKRFHIPDGSSAPGHYSCIEYGSNGRGGGSLVSNGDLEKSKRNEKPSGSGEPGLGEGLETMVWPPPAAKTPSRGSSKKSSLHSLRAASSCYGAGSSESSQVRQDNMEWMTRAMVSLGFFGCGSHSGCLFADMSYSESYTGTTTRGKKANRSQGAGCRPSRLVV